MSDTHYHKNIQFTNQKSSYKCYNECELYLSLVVNTYNIKMNIQIVLM